MQLINEFLLLGIILGFTAGISPGPLLAMVISETLQYGSKEGVKVAISPLITDLLIVSFMLLFLLRIESRDLIIAFISLFGSFYLVYLGALSFKTKNIDLDIATVNKSSLRKGILANFLSPHPYMFWISIGGPIILKALDVDMWSIIMFIAGFYTFLVGSKIVIALLVGRSRSFLASNYYLYTIRAMGIAYLVFAFFFIEQGISLFNLNI